MINNAKTSLDKSHFSSEDTNIDIFPARVSLTIYDNSNTEIFNKYGGWDSIGGILFSPIKFNNPNPSISNSNFAKPINPNEKKPPIEGEIVLIISLPNNNIDQNSPNQTYYYINIINIWNNPHHNINPDSLDSRNISKSQQKGYNSGSPIILDIPSNENTGDFKENSNVKSIKLFIGDTIYEGRYGQTIRLGSSYKTNDNFWKLSDDNGDPIIIFRNKKHHTKQEFTPDIENINEDNIIILSSTQRLNITPVSNKFQSFKDSYTPFKDFNKNQNILSSDRIIIKSKSDSIFLNSNRSIHLSSNKSINFDSQETIIDSNKIYLGDKNSNEPAILGNEFLKDFNNLLLQLSNLMEVLQTPIGTPVPGTPNLLIPPASSLVSNSIKTMINKINKYKSNIIKLK